MRTLGMVLVTIGVIIAALDWVFLYSDTVARRRAPLLHVAIILVGLGVLFIHGFNYSGG